MIGLNDQTRSIFGARTAAWWHVEGHILSISLDKEIAHPKRFLIVDIHFEYLDEFRVAPMDTKLTTNMVDGDGWNTDDTKYGNLESKGAFGVNPTVTPLPLQGSLWYNDWDTENFPNSGVRPTVKFTRKADPVTGDWIPNIVRLSADAKTYVGGNYDNTRQAMLHFMIRMRIQPGSITNVTYEIS